MLSWKEQQDAALEDEEREEVDEREDIATAPGGQGGNECGRCARNGKQGKTALWWRVVSENGLEWNVKQSGG